MNERLKKILNGRTFVEYSDLYELEKQIGEEKRNENIPFQTYLVKIQQRIMDEHLHDYSSDRESLWHALTRFTLDQTNYIPDCIQYGGYCPYCGRQM